MRNVFTTKINILKVKVCFFISSFYDQFVQHIYIGSGNPPDLIIDLTYGNNSGVIKSMSLRLGLPTVTSSIGLENDIK